MTANQTRRSRRWLVLLGSCLLLMSAIPVAVEAQDQQDGTTALPGASAPGAPKLKKRATGDEHPIAVVEQIPPLENPSAAVLPQALESPRDAMWSLGRALNAYRHVLQTEGRTFKNRQKINWIEERIAYCFDLSDVGPEFQNSNATDAAVRLREMMRRVPLEQWQSIPDTSQIAQLPAGSTGKDFFRFQDVPIELIRIQTGDREGKWVISKETRDRADSAFRRVKDIPPIAGKGDLMRLHFFEPGWMIPSAFVNHLPAWAGLEYFDQSIWQWFAAILTTCVTLTALVLMFVFAHHRMQRPLTIAGRICNLFMFLFTGLVMVVYLYFLQYHVFLHGIVLETFAFLTTAIMTIAFVSAILTFGVLVAEMIIASPRINPEGLDAALIRVAARSLSILMAVIIFFQILGEIGFSPTTILAGAGVTGLAIALAAQDTLKNFFASVILLLERPFREGDTIRIGDDMGRAESIGLRSTCLRISNGNLVFLPNEDVTHGRIENISRRPHIRCDMTIGVTYSTPHEQVERAIEIIRDAITEKIDSPMGRDPRVYFSEFADSSLVINCRYWQSTTDVVESQHVIQEINLEILRRFNEEGLEFAFPTMTIEVDGNPATDDGATPAQDAT